MLIPNYIRIACAFYLIYSLPAFAEIGMDPSFNSSGFVEVDFKFPSFCNDSSQAIVTTRIEVALELPNSQLMLAGRCEGVVDGSYQTLASLVRLNSDGSVDRTFCDGGQILPISGNISSMHYLNDGKILLLGSSTRGFLARISGDCQLDATFNDGTGIFQADESDGFTDMAVDPQGRIIVAGTMELGFFTPSYTFKIWRFLPNGETDPSFGDNGAVVLSELTWSVGVKPQVILDIDRGIGIAGAASGTDSLSYLGIARVSDNGEEILYQNLLTSISAPVGITATPAGKLAVLSQDESALRIGQVDFERGAIDFSFGNQGTTEIRGQFAFNYIRNAMIGNSSGRLVMVAQRTTPANDVTDQLSLFGFLSDGSLDSTFGENAEALVPMPIRGLWSITGLYDGKILVIGFPEYSSSPRRSIVARLRR